MNIDARIRSRSNELTLLAFMATVVMLFAAFTSAYLIRRTGSDWDTLSLPRIIWLNTAALLASSMTMEFARRSQSRRWLMLTTALGVGFLAGQGFVWRALATDGVFLSTSAFGSFLYMLTAVHGAHLIGGVGTLLYATVRQRSFGLCAVYWHFVDGVWLYLVLMLSVL